MKKSSISISPSFIIAVGYASCEQECTSRQHMSERHSHPALPAYLEFDHEPILDEKWVQLLIGYDVFRAAADRGGSAGRLFPLCFVRYTAFQLTEIRFKTPFC